MLYLDFIHEISRGPSGYERWRQRMGFFDPLSKPSVVFYCNGLGEIRTALPLLKRLRGKTGPFPIVLMVYARDAWRLMKSMDPPAVDLTLYNPYYAPGPVRRALTRLRAKCLVIMESDLCPLYIRTAKSLGIATAVLNFSFFHWRDEGMHGLSEHDFREMVRGMDLVTFKHSSVQKALLDSSGIPGQMKIVGNLRYGITETGSQLKDARLARFLEKAREDSFVLVAGSTYGVEEEIVLTALEDLLKSGRLLLVIAPRKAWKASRIIRMASRHGLRAEKRSALGKISGHPPVLVIDTMGELPDIYRFAHAAFVGGTIRHKGGHNFFEPAREGVPVMFGPHYYNNFEFASELLERGGGRRVDNPSDVRLCVSRWMSSEETRRTEGETARSCVSEGVQVMNLTEAALRDLLNRCMQ